MSRRGWRPETEPELDWNDALFDDTAGRTEPETVDVWADQAEVDWSYEPYSDEELSLDARVRLDVGRRR